MDNYFIKAIRMDGIETTYELFFTVVREETDEEFAFYIEMNSDSPGVLVYIRALDGSLIDIESEEDFAWASKVYEEHMVELRNQGDCPTCNSN